MISLYNSRGDNTVKLDLIAIVAIRDRNYTYYNVYRSCLLIDGIAIIRSLSF